MGIKAVAEGVGQFNNKVDSMNKSITKSNKAMDKAKKAGGKLSGVFGKMAAVVGIATGAFIAVRKALDFGREGALITQTGESFGFLIEKIGASSDLLDQLRAASKGTITDLQLMTSTATLLAGAGDDLALSLADATPQLLNIAKAANKLNPSLGTTAFLYQSIATGVKRAQPLILDNLGITIKVGEANEAFAKSIGKTVQELNAEEKAMAILQGTLVAGNNLIEQVGGNTDSATDSFDRASVAMEQAGQAIKQKLAPFLSRAAQGLFEVFTQADRMIVALEEQEQRTRLSATSWEEYNDEILRLENVAGRARDRFGALDTEMGFLIATFTDAEAPTRAFANTLGAIETEANGVAEANRNIVLSLTELTEAKLASEALGALNTAFKEGTIDADTYRSEFVNVAAKLGNMDSEAIKAQLSLFDLKQELAAGKTSAIEFADELVRTGDEFKEIDFGEDITIQFLENTQTDFLEAQVQAAAIAVEAGDTTAWGAATELADGFAGGVLGARDAIKEAREELALLDGTTVDVVIEITTTGGLPEFQHGGQFTVGGKPGVDTNLVAFRASRGEVVTVTPTSSIDNRSVNTGDIHMGGGGMTPTTFDRMMRDWIGA